MSRTIAALLVALAAAGCPPGAPEEGPPPLPLFVDLGGPTEVQAGEALVLVGDGPLTDPMDQPIGGTWEFGDGESTPATITAGLGGRATFSATHVYIEPANRLATMRLSGPDGRAVIVHRAFEGMFDPELMIGHDCAQLGRARKERMWMDAFGIGSKVEEARMAYQAEYRLDRGVTSLCHSTLGSWLDWEPSW
jgi:hypothetical protein